MSVVHGKMPSVALHNLGCKVNAYETEAMTEMLENAGFEIVPFKDDADIYIINTCTVTNIADRKSRQMLHKAKKKNKDAIVIATGCYVQVAADDILKDNAIDIVVGNDVKRNIVEIIKDYLENKDLDSTKKNIIDINDVKVKREFEELNIEKSIEEKTRAYIKIQDGCNQFCSYCIIPFARGRVRSRIFKNIETEAKRLADKGFKELVLTGIHISSYEYEDESGKYTLADVVDVIGNTEGIERVRLGSLEPRIITKEFMEKISKTDSVCPHFHLSLQSGCDETLNRMNRKYTSGEFYEGVKLIREYYPDAAITTDVIVGFPGETDEEFEKTKEFLEKVAFSKMHIFKYSVRKGTRAAHMENQIPEEIKALRSNALLELNDRMLKDYQERFIGKEIEVLFEEETEFNGEKYIVGHTMEYVKVAVKSENKGNDIIEKICKVKIEGFLDNEIMLAML
ncbi:threonylcarbamoyladenosine tRNA methylthiotransferase MtaB [Lachnospiraceae bacterium RM5]|nr:threonylcarbamoyladenosine tRNA methylthiotransferase MtaB [Lachnospiraceae bacterium RM5]